MPCQMSVINNKDVITLICEACFSGKYFTPNKDIIY